MRSVVVPIVFTPKDYVEYRERSLASSSHAREQCFAFVGGTG